MCAATRTIHIELVGSLSTDTFFLAFRHFNVRYEACPLVFSDCAHAYKCAELELKQLWVLFNHSEVINDCASNGIKWKYIIERAKNNLPQFKVNNIVLIKNDYLLRNFWKLGRILELFPGRDSKVRACRLKSESSIIKRPVQLYNLELLT